MISPSPVTNSFFKKRKSILISAKRMKRPMPKTSRVRSESIQRDTRSQREAIGSPSSRVQSPKLLSPNTDISQNQLRYLTIIQKAHRLSNQTSTGFNSPAVLSRMLSRNQHFNRAGVRMSSPAMTADTTHDFASTARLKTFSPKKSRRLAEEKRFNLRKQDL